MCKRVCEREAGGSALPPFICCERESAFESESAREREIEKGRKRDTEREGER